MASGTVREVPVFAAPDGRRGRRLRAAAVVFSALVTLWLAGLVAGLLGFDALPALHVPGAPATGADKVAPSASSLPASVRAQRALQGQSGSATASRPAPTGGSGQTPAEERRAATRDVGDTTTPSPSSTTAPTAAATPAAPAATPAPAPRPGRRVGQTTDQTQTQPIRATPPGQAKAGPGPAAPALERSRSADAGPKPKP